MRESEFWANIDWVFPGRGRSLAQDLTLGALGDQSPAAAIAGGADAQAVWNAVCDAMDLPEPYRYLHRAKPEDRGDRPSL